MFLNAKSISRRQNKYLRRLILKSVLKKMFLKVKTVSRAVLSLPYSILQFFSAVCYNKGLKPLAASAVSKKNYSRQALQ